MGNFSQPPTQCLTTAQQAGAVAVHIGQGVPLLDRNLNLLGDLSVAQAQQIFASLLGSGGLAVKPATDATGVVNSFDFVIGAGSVLAGPPGGSSVAVFTNPADLAYSQQLWPAGVTRDPPLGPYQFKWGYACVYLDAWVREVDNTIDSALANVGDVGVRTSVRVQAGWVVRATPVLVTSQPQTITVPPGAPATYPGGFTVPLAQLIWQPDPVTGIPYLTTISNTFSSRLADLAKQARSMEEALRPVITSVTPQSGGPVLQATVLGQNVIRGVSELTIGPRSVPPQAIVTPPATGPASATQQSLLVEPREGADPEIRVVNPVGETRGTFFTTTPPLPPGSSFTVSQVKVAGVSGVDISVLGRRVWLISTTAIDGGRQILKWTGAAFAPIPGHGVPAERIAVAPDGTAWIVTSSGNIAYYEAGVWYNMPGRAADISVGADGSVYKVGMTKGNEVARWTGSGWEVLTGAPAGLRIAVGGFRQLYVLDGSMFVNQFYQEQWRTMFTNPNTSVSAQVQGTDVCAGFNLPMYNANAWVGVPANLPSSDPSAPPPKPTGAVSVGFSLQAPGSNLTTRTDQAANLGVASLGIDTDNNLWVIDTNGAVYVPKVVAHPTLPSS